MATRIEWTDETWNPVTGCSHAGTPGCDKCYARRMAHRLRGRFGYPADEPFRVTFHRDRLDQPTRWHKSRRVFVCSMGDLWHRDVNPRDRTAVIRATNPAPQHVYLFLTKRPCRFHLFSGDWTGQPNFWLGVSVENNRAAQQRVPALLAAKVAHRCVSCEPLLEGHVDLTPYLHALEWVICGAETGPGARRMDDEWTVSVRDQCKRAGVPFFFKRDSRGSRLLDGAIYEGLPQFFRGE